MIGMFKGMATTIGHLFRPTFNAGYPGVPKVLPERSRSSFTLLFDENGAPVCKSCMLCAKSCPDGAITIESDKREDGPGRELRRFTIDLGLCMYCGLCVDNCSSAGLAHTGDFENATPERVDTLLVLYEREGSPAARPLGESAAAGPAADAGSEAAG